jgi:ribosomal-protein-alanine N-acetyltransferase
MVELVKNFDQKLIQRLVQLESEAFGVGGMNEWHLVPFIRHGRVYITRSQEEEVIGLVQYFLDWNHPQKAYMMGVSITKEYRGKGLGTRFIKETFAALAKERIKEVELTVDPKNIAAVKVYQNKLGLQVIDFRKNEYGDGEDRLVMNTLLVGIQ